MVERLTAWLGASWSCHYPIPSYSIIWGDGRNKHFHRLSKSLPTRWKDWCWSWNSSTLVIWCEQLTHGKVPDSGKDWGQRRRGSQKMRWLDGITKATDMSLGKLLEMVRDRDAWHAVVHWVAKSQTWLSEQTTRKSACMSQTWRKWLGGQIGEAGPLLGVVAVCSLYSQLFCGTHIWGVNENTGRTGHWPPSALALLWALGQHRCGHCFIIAGEVGCNHDLERF